MKNKLDIIKHGITFALDIFMFYLLGSAHIKEDLHGQLFLIGAYCYVYMLPLEKNCINIEKDD